MSYALMGLEVKTVGDLRPQVEHARELLSPIPRTRFGCRTWATDWTPARRRCWPRGSASALRTVNGYQSPPGWQGFISDTIMRRVGHSVGGRADAGFCR